MSPARRLLRPRSNISQPKETPMKTSVESKPSFKRSEHYARSKSLSESILVSSHVETIQGIASDDAEMMFTLNQSALNCKSSGFLQNFLFGSSHMDEMSLASLNNLFDRFYKYFTDVHKQIAYNDCVFFLTRYFSALRKLILHVYLDDENDDVSMKRHVKEARHLLFNMHDMVELILNCISDSESMENMRTSVAFFKIYCDLYNSFIAHLVKSRLCEEISEESVNQQQFFRPLIAKILLMKFNEIIVKQSKNRYIILTKI